APCFGKSAEGDDLFETIATRGTREVGRVIRPRSEASSGPDSIAYRRTHPSAADSATCTRRRVDASRKRGEVTKIQPRPTCLLQSEEDSLQRDTGRKGSRSIDGIDEPAIGAVRLGARALLPEHPVVRIALRDHRPDELLRSSVSSGQRGAIALERDGSGT